MQITCNKRMHLYFLKWKCRPLSPVGLPWTPPDRSRPWIWKRSSHATTFDAVKLRHKSWTLARKFGSASPFSRAHCTDVGREVLGMWYIVCDRCTRKLQARANTEVIAEVETQMLQDLPIIIIAQLISWCSPYRCSVEKTCVHNPRYLHWQINHYMKKAIN